jgi:hypothetical protein
MELCAGGLNPFQGLFSTIFHGMPRECHQGSCGGFSRKQNGGVISGERICGGSLTLLFRVVGREVEFSSSAINRAIHLLDPGVDRNMAEREECRLEWSWISIRTSGGRGRDSESVQAIPKTVQAVAVHDAVNTALLRQPHRAILPPGRRHLPLSDCQSMCNRRTTN